MMPGLKSALLLSFALLYAPSAPAQSSSTEARLQALEAQIAQLRAELAAERARGENDIILLEEKIKQPVTPASKASNISRSGFQLGETKFKLGGYVDFDTHVSHFSEGSVASGSAGRDFHVPFTIPVGDDAEGSTVTDFTAQATRLSLGAERDVGRKTASAYIETDFLVSTQGNERISNSFSPRLRRAYVDYNGWRFGQDWSTLQNTSVIPESASFYTLSDGQIFIRQPLIRYTHGDFQIALENGNTSIIPAGGTNPLGVEADSNLVPDVVLRYNLTGNFGNISLAAIGRQLRLDSIGEESETDLGWGLSASGRLNFGKGDIRFGITGGEGLGRYIGLNLVAGGAVDPLTGDVHAIPSIGGHIAIRYPLSQTTRLSAGVAQLSVDTPEFALGSITDRSRSAYGALLWDIVPKVTIGVEGLMGQRRTEDGTDGTLSRFTFSTKYGF